jgi:hypothetical protein
VIYNKEAEYQTFIRFGLLPAKERFEHNPKTKDYIDVILKVIKEDLDAYFNDDETQNKLKMTYANIYMEEFSKSELEEMINFYETKTGQKVIQKLPVIMQKGFERGIEFGSKLPPKYEQMEIKKIEELQKKGILPKKFE